MAKLRLGSFCVFKNMKKHPIQRRPAGRGYPVQQYRTPNLNVPASIVPKFTKGRNVAAQVSTKIHLKNARGEEMTIYQNQQLLNLLNGAKGNWHISDGGTNSRKRRHK